MTVYAILASEDNAYDIAGFEDISLNSAAAAIDAATFNRDEPTFVVYGHQFDEHGFDVPAFLSKSEIDAQYTYNGDLINHTITKLVHK